MTSASRGGVLGKAKESLAHVVLGMHVMYHDLREATGIKMAIPELSVVRGALQSLGSSACMAVHSLLDEYQNPDCNDRLGLSMKRLSVCEPLNAKKITDDARHQLLDFIRCNKKSMQFKDAASVVIAYGGDAPKKSPVKLQDIINILSTIGRDLTSDIGHAPSPWSGPAQQRHAAEGKSMGQAQKGSFPTESGSKGSGYGTASGSQEPKGSFPMGPALGSKAPPPTRSPSRSNKMPKKVKGSEWRPSLQKQYDAGH